MTDSQTGKTCGLLLLNLGTPDTPEPDDVGRYLREFLMDGRVIDTPWLLRWFLVNVLIIPKRKYASSEAYKTVWTSRGSPLLFHLEDLRDEVVRQMEASGAARFEVDIAMRYQNPSVEQALKNFTAKGIDEVFVFPLYPQYAESSTLSSIEHSERVAMRMGYRGRLHFIGAFYEQEDFIESYVSKLKPVLETEKPDHVLMSFHGLPVRHVKRTDRSGGKHCMSSPGCCDKITEVNQDCYRAQSFATARAIAARAGLPSEKYSVSFQSRLGRAEWIPPYTDKVTPQLAEKGIKNLAVICPSFVADCLETIEEIGDRAAELFKEAGGQKFTLIPCLNSDPAWANAIVKIIGFQVLFPDSRR